MGKQGLLLSSFSFLFFLSFFFFLLFFIYHFDLLCPHEIFRVTFVYAIVKFMK